MKNFFFAFLKNSYLQSFIVIAACNLLAKHGVMHTGLAVDDYTVNGDVDLAAMMYGQGRYLQVACNKLIALTGTNIIDLYAPLGLLSLLVQAAFVVCTMRFLQIDQSIIMNLVGALMVTHPYATEILTFRMALPAYCVTMMLVCVVLESLHRAGTAMQRAIALVSLVAALLTYQVVLSYLMLIVLLGFFFSATNIPDRGAQSSAQNRLLAAKSLELVFVSLVAVGFFYAIDGYIKHRYGFAANARASFIRRDEISLRVQQVQAAIKALYWAGDPLMPLWAKRLSGLLMSYAVLQTLFGLCKNSMTQAGRRSKDLMLCIAAACTFIPASLGVITLIQDWWPVYRVLSQVSLLYVLLIVVLQSAAKQHSIARVTRSALIFASALLLIHFILINNQVFADQRRINTWDQNRANHIVARLEDSGSLEHVTVLHVDGGGWRYPFALRTTYMDLNISAWQAGWARTHLINYVSGYHFEQANGDDLQVGAHYCKTASLWPAKDSTAIRDHLAIVCLPRM